MMSLLQRYVLRKFIYCYVMSVAGLVGIFLVVDFFERVDEFVRRDVPYLDLLLKIEMAIEVNAHTTKLTIGLCMVSSIMQTLYWC